MKIGHNYYVYIVECADGLYYTGVTNNVDRRVEEHNIGIDTKCFTYKRRPVTLRYYEHIFDINHAIQYEKQVKGWLRRKKEAVFVNDIEELKRLSNCKKGRTGNVVDSSPGSE